MLKDNRRKSFKIAVISFLLVISLVVLSGCPFGGGGEKKPEGGGQGGQQEKTKIGISMSNLQGDTAKAIQEAFKEDKAVEVVAKDAKRDPMQQTIDVEELIKEEVKVIILDIADPTQGEKLVARAKEKDIKVIAVYNLPENAPVDAYITPDNPRTGELQGEYVAKELDQGKVLILQGDPKSNVAQEITSGNLVGLQQNPNLQILEVQSHEEWQPEKAELSVRQALMENNNQIGAIIANNSELAQSAVKVLKEEALHAQVITVGADADKAAMEAVVKTEHDAEVDRRPDIVGDLVMQAAKQMAEGENWTDFDRKIKNGEHDVPVKIVPVRLVTMENIFLVKERLGEMKKEDEGPGQGVEKVGEGEGGQEGGQEGQGQKPSKVSITTQDGQKLEFELSGQTLEIEIEGRLKRVETMQEGEGAGGGGGQGGEAQGGGGGGS